MDTVAVLLVALSEGIPVGGSGTRSGLDPAILASIVGAAGTVVAALIVGVAGGIISYMYQRERDRQDKESEWREHTIALAKLDLERKVETVKNRDKDWPRLRPSILDLLANYRDLKELDDQTPADLYQTIRERRIVDASKKPGT